MGLVNILAIGSIGVYVLPLVGGSVLPAVTAYTLVQAHPLALLLWYSGVGLAGVSVWVASSRLTHSTTQLRWYCVFAPLVAVFVGTSNLLTLFVAYELFLLPSFMVVFFGSPNRRGVIASLYFLMWTQVGSFLVFVAVVGVFLTTHSFEFASIHQAPSVVVAFAVIGFGIKVPVWPGHYWLTKTHVEAPTYFSIYLSGFLVKTALYGLWVFVCGGSGALQAVLVGVAVIGIVDSSIKMWAQVDLKKLVAYATIQEMNLILIGLVLGSAPAVRVTLLFILAHTILSTMFFTLADSLYRRFGVRSTSAVYGLLSTHPALGSSVFGCCLLFAGLPFTLKFVVEVFIYLQLWNLDAGVVVLAGLICNWVGLVSFLKHWLATLFGSTRRAVGGELTTREGFVYSILAALLLVIGFAAGWVL